MHNQIRKAITRVQTKLDNLKQTQNETSKFINRANASFENTSCFDDSKETEKFLHNQTLKQVASALNIHRHKLNVLPTSVLGLVTKLITKKDKEWHSSEAKKALRDEVLKLVNGEVWCETAQSKRAMAKKYDNAVFSRLFAVMGIKNWGSDDPIFKGRVVLQGSNMHDYEGNEVFYNDTSSAPTSMACIRTTVSYGALTSDPDPLKDGSAAQANACQAYIQRKIEPGENLFVSIPREMRTDKMVESAKGISDPVFRLLLPLYGWSRSGNLWEKHLDETLQTMQTEAQREKAKKANTDSIKLQAIETARQTCERIDGKDGWPPMPGWPQTYIKMGPLKGLSF